MSKYILKSIPDPNNIYDISEITFEFETDNRDIIIKEFIAFLKGNGYLTKDLEEEFGI